MSERSSQSVGAVHGLHADTVAVHAGRQDARTAGWHAPPIDLSSTYPLGDLTGAGASLDALAHGAARAPEAVYARLFNPTVDRFEQALAAMEGAEEAVAFASGMAAVTATLLAARQWGDHVVAVRPLYGGTDHLLASQMLGLPVRWADPEAVADVVTKTTALVMVETPANPTLRVVDIAALVQAAGSVPVLVDNTFATPVLQRPLAHGAAMVLHSATKFLGGHGDVVGGVVACDAARAAALRQVRVATGALMHPLAAWLLHRGMPTLGLRVRAQQATARALVERLPTLPGVDAVYYPGLADRASAAVVARQMDGPGAVFAFALSGGFEAARAVTERVRLLTPAVSLGSVDSLIQHPASLTHRVVDPEVRAAHAISGGLLRVSVGLEHVDDLWRDLAQAIEATASKARA